MSVKEVHRCIYQLNLIYDFSGGSMWRKKKCLSQQKSRLIYKISNSAAVQVRRLPRPLNPYLIYKLTPNTPYPYADSTKTRPGQMPYCSLYGKVLYQP